MQENTEKKKITKEKLYDLIKELTKKGKTNSEIGLYIKKNEKVLNIKKMTGKRILKIQEELSINNKLPDDLIALIRKSVKLIKHKDSNKKDMTSLRGYQLTISKINRLRKYYIKKGKIPKTWRYSDKTAKLLVK